MYCRRANVVAGVLWDALVPLQRMFSSHCRDTTLTAASDSTASGGLWLGAASLYRIQIVPASSTPHSSASGIVTGGDSADLAALAAAARPGETVTAFIPAHRLPATGTTDASASGPDDHALLIRAAQQPLRDVVASSLHTAANSPAAPPPVLPGAGVSVAELSPAAAATPTTALAHAHSEPCGGGGRGLVCGRSVAPTTSRPPAALVAADAAPVAPAADGAAVQYPCNATDWSLLRAAPGAELSAMQAAIEAGASVQLRHPDHGCSALHLVCSGHGDDDDVARGIQLLLQHGLAVNAPAANGATALHFAAGAGNIIAVRTLLDAGADPCASTYTWRRQVFGKGSGQTPLHWAAESDQMHVVKLLSAASPLSAVLPDERGTTPRSLADSAGHRRVATALQQVEDTPYVRVHIAHAHTTAVTTATTE